MEMKKVPALVRRLDVAEFRMHDDRRLTMSASSTFPVERFFGSEVLDHTEDAVRLDRAEVGSMPLLFNHDMGDPIGMVDAARVSDGRLMVEAHLFDTERAADIEKMIRGGLRNVSVGYRLHRVEEMKDGSSIVREWEPFETSIVTVPADPTVGVGRAFDTETEVRFQRAESQSAETAAKPKENAVSEETQTETRAEDAAETTTDQTRPAVVEDRPSQPNAVEMERKRQEGIDKLCRINKVDENIKKYWVNAGLSLDQVADDLLRIIEDRGNTNPEPASKLGLSRGETQSFSLRRAIVACSQQDWAKAGFELECSRAIQEKLNKAPDPTKFYVPFEVMQDKRISPEIQRRDLTVGTAADGGFLVETENMGFIEILRNRSVAFRMGVRRLSGLQGNLTVPRQDGAATPFWLASESTQITESQQTFSQMSLSPKTVGAYTEVSRQLLLQSSPDAEGIVNTDLAAVCALAVDQAVINGSGAAGQPQGIIGTGGVGSVTGTTLGYAGILEFQTDVAAANIVPQAGGYVTTASVAALLMQRERFAGTDTPLWSGNIWNGQVSGFGAMSSNQMPADNMLFGDWSEAVVGEWGVLEVETNPYANFQAGIIGVRAMYSVDVAVRRAAAFSLATAIT